MVAERQREGGLAWVPDGGGRCRRRRFCSASEKNLLYTGGVSAGGHARREQNPTTLFQMKVDVIGEMMLLVNVNGVVDYLFCGGCVLVTQRAVISHAE